MNEYNMGYKTDVDFLLEIETIVNEKQLNHFEALLFYIEQNDLEIETIAKLVKTNQNLKTKIRETCESLNLVEKTAKLPV